MAENLVIDATYKIVDVETVNFTPGERSAVFWVTTDVVDHEGDVVVAEGVDFKTLYWDPQNPDGGNPVVLAIHNLGRWPVGHSEWVKIRRTATFTGLYAKVLFDTDPDSEVVWGKVRGRTLRGASIGFRPPEDLRAGEWGPPTREELRKRPDWAPARRVIRRSVMFEWSVVPIGMNPTCLALAVNKGMHRPATAADWEVSAMGENAGGNLPALPASVSGAQVPAVEAKTLPPLPAPVRKDANPEEPPAPDDRIMIAFYPDLGVAQKLSVAGGEPAEEIHLTLAYLGRASEVGTNALDRVRRILGDVVRWVGPLIGSVNGLGRFSAGSEEAEGKDVVYAAVDVPALADFRQRLCECLRSGAVEYSQDHGFTPHMTLAYVERAAKNPIDRVEPTPVVFDTVYLVVENEREAFRFQVPALEGSYPLYFRAGPGGVVKDSRKVVRHEPERAEGHQWVLYDHTGEKVIGTHPSKAKAQEQERAVESAKHTDKAFAPGDHVRIRKGLGGGCGTIKSLHTEGHVPGVAEDVIGSKEFPAAKVELHDKDHQPTGRMKGMLCGHMKAFELAAPDGDEEDEEEAAPDEKTLKALTEDEKSMHKALGEVAKTIKHCGDYGKGFWHHEQKAVHWTMADSDGDGKEYDTSKEIEKKFKAVDGVKRVEFGDESDPDEEKGWKRFHPSTDEKGEDRKGFKALCDAGRKVFKSINHSGKAKLHASEEGMALHHEMHEDDLDEDKGYHSAKAIRKAYREGCKGLGCKGFGVQAEPPDEEDHFEHIAGRKAKAMSEASGAGGGFGVPVQQGSDEDEDDEGEGEEPESIGVGDSVRFAKGRRGVGKVLSIHKSGIVPHVEEDLVGTKAEPAARVRLYKAYGDGHKATSLCVGHKVKHLEKIDGLKSPTRTEAKSLGAYEEPLPPLPAQPVLPPLPAAPPLTAKDATRVVRDALAETDDRLRGRLPR